ncbi:hypothetical protein CRENBAI_025387 [Crenichthys baileyi]|uniref:Secreted protein n=1 Tax=Crenichthys baileyi TaxID=28760 RepID=A0AAV9R8P4_9TELE
MLPINHKHQVFLAVSAGLVQMCWGYFSPLQAQSGWVENQLSWLYASGRRAIRAGFRSESVFGCCHRTFEADRLPSSNGKEMSPQHDAATTMLHSGDMSQVMICACLSPVMRLGVQAKRFSFGFISPENVVSSGLKMPRQAALSILA